MKRVLFSNICELRYKIGQYKYITIYVFLIHFWLDVFAWYRQFMCVWRNESSLNFSNILIPTLFKLAFEASGVRFDVIWPWTSQTCLHLINGLLINVASKQ